MSIDYRAIGQRIQARRKEMHRTQDSLAEALSVSVGYVSQLERGVTKISLDTLGSIADFLGCDIAELVTGTVPIQQRYLQNEFNEVLKQLNQHQRRLLLRFAHVMAEEGGSPPERGGDSQ